MNFNVYTESLAYHRRKPYGKIAVVPTKPVDDREDLALAYSPGVAEPCMAIYRDPNEAAELTSRSNLIAVISNGTAVLGLGNIGALASKPVMEGKAILFKKFANIDAFDIEIDETDTDKLVEIIASLEPTFGGINLEDIKAPECFEIERRLKERMNIPVFHDDQHGTAVIVCAAIKNALELANKSINNVRLVTAGAGASALACLDLLIELGMKRENITVCDSKGVIYANRPDLSEPSKLAFAQHTENRTLADALAGADIFLGLSSVPNIMTKEMLLTLAENPIILALSNPEPEISPKLVLELRPDAIVATGRSDFPNQVNNAVCFPYIFRGALDVGARNINQAMKIACVNTIAQLAKAESSDIVSNAYGGEIHRFGRNYIIPKPFDARLYVEISYAVAQAAMDSGIALRPIKNMTAYHQELESFVYKSSSVMRPIFDAAAKPTDRPIKLAFAEGEDTRVLQAVQSLADKGIGHCILIGRPDVIQWRIEHLGLRIQKGIHYNIIDPNCDERFTRYWQAYHSLMERKGVTPEIAKVQVRTKNTIIASLLVHLGDADAMICGLIGRYVEHFQYIRRVLGLREDAKLCAAMTTLIIDDKGPLFCCDPYLNENPTAEMLEEMTKLAINQIRRFGIKPKIALVSHSNFGSSKLESAEKMRTVLTSLKANYPELEIEGEMHADLALDETLRSELFPNSQLTGSANLLIFPNIESANISYNMVKSITDCSTIGPILMGLDGVAHILSPGASVRTIVNLATFSVVEARERFSC
ncbi:MAG: NADP-dependent malic enzyme [Candidatus Paracaedibacteraceae bacterium]|nr:NADP-dependent malic enzyme [Candidatus Paracaedibacteraceae bacterium]